MSMNIYQRVHSITSKGLALDKTRKMTSGGTYKFHEADVLMAFLRPLLAEAGIAFTTSVEAHSYETRDYQRGQDTKFERTTIKHVRCRLVNIDDPTDFIEGVEVGYGVDPQDKGPGKATSYAIKTWLINQFSLRGQPDENTTAMEGINDALGFISDSENATLRQAVEKTGANEEEFLAHFKVEGYEHFTKKQFGVALKLLEAKAKKQGAK